MKKQEIKEQLSKWVKEGRLTSRTYANMKSYDTIKMLEQGELLRTSISFILVSDPEVQAEFEVLVANGSVMCASQVGMKMGLHTAYAIKLACENGDILKFNDLGRWSILYIK